MNTDTIIQEKNMEITTKQFQILTDISTVWELMTQSYEPLFANGVAAPFFEYALTSSWLDKRYLYLNRLWYDGDRAAGFVFYENPVTSVYFILRRGYECLADEMVRYAAEKMPGSTDGKELIFFSGQKALIEAAERYGFAEAYTDTDMHIDLMGKIPEYPLPGGYHYVGPLNVDPVKFTRMMWYGFGNDEEAGEFVNWDSDNVSGEWSPAVSYQGVLSSITAPPPHSTYGYNLLLADENEEYVCFSGMWWVPGNRLAYMEPLCTVPEHRRRGLAAALISEHCRRMKALGAEYMTGGGNEFYRKIGYDCEVRWHHYRSKQ